MWSEQNSERADARGILHIAKGDSASNNVEVGHLIAQNLYRYIMVMFLFSWRNAIMVVFEGSTFLYLEWTLCSSRNWMWIIEDEKELFRERYTYTI